MKIKNFMSPKAKHVSRKDISRFLAIGIILNNIYFNSNASNIEISNRYETLEGENIVIDDSVEGELHEIEIFGNTVQDENSLEDIQSVGDLYVDEEGEPILDEQGREQYKIDIVSKTANLLDIDNSSLKRIVWNYPMNASLDEQKVTFENEENQRDNTYLCRSWE